MFEIITNQLCPNAFKSRAVPNGVQNGVQLITTDIAKRLSQLKTVEVDICDDTIMQDFLNEHYDYFRNLKTPN